KRKRFFSYLVVEYDNKIYTRKRTGKDIWHGLYEFLLIESSGTMHECELTKLEDFRTIFANTEFEIKSFSETFTQELTHQTIVGNFIGIKVNEPLDPGKEFKLVTKKGLKRLPFSKFISSYLED
ncbi:MAG: NUDIX domain-containing protein, partial [Ginsengibacter sp.]